MDSSHAATTTSEAVIIVAAGIYEHSGGEPTKSQIFGPKLQSVDDFPEEGFYVLCGGYQQRALQIAASPCERRECSRSQTCSCRRDTATEDLRKAVHVSDDDDASWNYVESSACTAIGTGNTTGLWPEAGDLSKTAQAADLQLLRVPRALTRVGQREFAFDDDIPADFAVGRRDVVPLTHGQSLRDMREAYRDLLDDDTTTTTTTTRRARLRSSWAHHHRYSYHHYHYFADPDSDSGYSSAEDDGEWDDCDAPAGRGRDDGVIALKQAGGGEDEEEEEFDLFEDVIADEFPRLRCAAASKSQHVVSVRNVEVDVDEKVGEDEEEDENGEKVGEDEDEDENGEDDDRPVPVVIPPKGMRLAEIVV